MATQTLEFNAGTGLTISCKLFAIGSDTVVATATATEKTNDDNRYAVEFTDIPAGAYRLNGFVSSVGGFANEIYDLTLETATFYPRSETKMRGTDNAALAATALSTATWTGTLATNLGTTNTTVATNLNATVSSRLALASYTAPPTASANASQVRTELATELGRIDATISSRSAFNAASNQVTVATNNDKTGYSLIVAPLTSEQTQTAAAAALTAYDPPTRTEATSDKDAVLSAISGAKSTPDKIAVRSSDDTTPVRFAWPTSGETITVERSLNNAAYEAATGTVSFFRTEGTEHWYTLSYNAADRAVGVVRYRLNDGTITRYVTLRVELPTLTAANVWEHATRSLTTFGTLVSDIWSAGTRTLTAISDSSGITTLLGRILGTLAAGTHEPQTGDSFARLGAPAGASIAADIAAIEGGGAGDTAEEIVDEIVARGITAIPVQSGVTSSGNLELIQGDTYNGTAKPLLSFPTSANYTDGWTATLTIRDEEDAVIATASGVVVSSTQVTVSFTTPTGLTFTGCPGVWQGKFDVQMSKSTQRATIARGIAYVYEDQTRS
jgi:hypothetical protein